MGKSTTRRRTRKVSKPPKPDGFPLTPHNSGLWSKKIRNPRTGKAKLWYFTRWGRIVGGKMDRLPDDGRQDALRLWNAQKDDLLAGREPRVRSLDDLNPDGTPKENPDVLTLRVLCNRFLVAKSRKKAARELSPRTFLELKGTTDRLIETFGREQIVDDLTADDFGTLRASIAEKWGPTRLSNEITRVKSVFKFAFDNGMIDRPVRYGSEFSKPDKSVLRRHKARNGKKTIDAKTIRKLIKSADPPMRAMILLGINCGYGNTDVANLQQPMIEGDWIDYPRPKSGIERRNPIWPETKAAIEAAIAERPAAADEADEDCVFLTSHGKRWVRNTEKSRTDNVANAFGKLTTAAELRKGIGLYALRHVFQTVADQARDPIATKFLMGHADATMSGVYREFVSDENLIAVSNHVRTWLYGDAKEGGAN